MTTSPVELAFSLTEGTTNSATEDNDYDNEPTFSNGVNHGIDTGNIIVPSGVKDFTVTYPTKIDALIDSGETTTLNVGGVIGTGIIIDAPNSYRSDLQSLKEYNVQMHLHGHSNHNGHSQPASMQWHSAQIHEKQIGDVLWWNDHTNVFNQKSRFFIELNSDTAEVSNHSLKFSNTTNLALPSAMSSNCISDELSLTETSAIWNVQSNDESWLSCTLKLEGVGRRTIKGVVWPRPISSGATLNVHWKTNKPNTNINNEIQLLLAWHRDTNSQFQHRLHYKLIPESNEPYSKVLSKSVIEIGIPYKPNGQYSLDLQNDIFSLKDGTDNTLSQITFLSSSRAQQNASSELSKIEISSTNGEVENQVNQMHKFANEYSNRYSQKQFIGFEHGDKSNGHHFNAFIPEIGLETPFLSSFTTIHDWIKTVHDFNGLVSFNHPFGTSSGYFLLKTPSEVKSSLEKFIAIALDTKLNFDILEVGYLSRGGALLQDHLNAWDILTANGKKTMGIGVTDSHGGVMTANSPPGSFSTWVLSESSSGNSLVAAMKKHRGWFGNPHLWNGSFTFRLGTAFMGETLEASRNTEELVYKLTNTTERNLKVYLVQGLIKPGKTTEYIHKRKLLNNQRQIIDTTKDSFIRLEVYEGDNPLVPEGNPIVFSNNIYIKR